MIFTYVVAKPNAGHSIRGLVFVVIFLLLESQACVHNDNNDNHGGAAASHFKFQNVICTAPARARHRRGTSSFITHKCVHYYYLRVTNVVHMSTACRRLYPKNTHYSLYVSATTCHSAAGGVCMF